MRILLMALAMLEGEIAFYRLANSKILNLIYKYNLDIYEIVQTSERAFLL